MFLDVCPFNVSGLIKRLLGMGLPHIRTLPPFRLDRVPGILSGPIGDYAKTRNIRTIERDGPLASWSRKVHSSGVGVLE